MSAACTRQVLGGAVTAARLASGGARFESSGQRDVGLICGAGNGPPRRRAHVLTSFFGNPAREEAGPVFGGLVSGSVSNRAGRGGGAPFPRSLTADRGSVGAVFTCGSRPVADMRAEGMSTRAIASGLGVDNATVHRDLARVADATPDAAAAQPITGQDGKTYRQAAVGGGE
jgi:hypothetical protein